MMDSLNCSPRILAVDWSGAQAGSEKTIWLGEVTEDGLARLECGRSRQKLIGHLVEMSQADPRFVVGLDFAFSMPEWYLSERGINSALELWSLVSEQGENWLRECPRPFWGRNRVKKWNLPEEFRKTELAVPQITGIRPKSVFQVYGAGAVGTGSIRGMPFLRQLHQAGFSIWPFDPPGWPLVVEIYPRVLTGPVQKSQPGERARYIRTLKSDLPEHMAMLAASSEDAFDAAVSALEMNRHRHLLSGLEQATDPTLSLEGIIWHPGWEQAMGMVQ